MITIRYEGRNLTDSVTLTEAVKRARNAISNHGYDIDFLGDVNVILGKRESGRLKWKTHFSGAGEIGRVRARIHRLKVEIVKAELRRIAPILSAREDLVGFLVANPKAVQ